MGLKLCALASGSSGNCIYVGTDDTHIIVDAGITAKRITDGLKELGISPPELDGVLITHEHSDHIGGLKVFTKKYGIPIYATPGTIEGIKRSKSNGYIDERLFRPVSTRHSFIVNDVIVSPMEVSHDTLEPCAYRFAACGRRIAVVTDLGVWDEKTVEELTGMDFLYIESNHDVRMVETGRYPWRTKLRILGEQGHLSNESCGRLLSRLIHDDLKGVMLAHLSADNNIPELAYETVRCEIVMGGRDLRRIEFPLMVAKRSELSELIEL